ncbi:peptide chain release factor N(5)-glutamine methyltransferase [Nitrospira sp. Kam-Ns4a]
MTPGLAQRTPAEAGPAPATAGALLRAGVALLRQAGIENAAREAGWLVAAALSCSSLTLRLEADRLLEAKHRRRAWALLTRRAAREPLQYLLGTQEFCGLEFAVSPAVLIPRPETELLVEELVRAGCVRGGTVVADVGTGSGCIAVAAARALPGALVYATDLSRDALRVAQDNAARHGVADRVRFLAGDGCRPLAAEGLHGRLAALVSNPPYVPDAELDRLQPEVGRFEPRLALAGGPDGLTLHRRLLSEAKPLLIPGGLLALEVGQGQAGRLRELAEAEGGYRYLGTRHDAAGIERVVCLQRMPT